MDGIFDLIGAFFDLVDPVMPFMPLVVGSIFLAISLALIREDLKFARAESAEGIIVSVPETGRDPYPVIEYHENGETRRFKSSMAARGAKTGQLIDIEINAAGDARIRSPSHKQMAFWFTAFSLTFVAVGIYIALEG